MKDRRTYYEILHVQPNAPLRIIRSSYRILMQHMNNHPDRGGDAGEAALINRAYAVLSNEEKRAEYDLTLSNPFVNFKPAEDPEPAAAEPEPEPEPPKPVDRNGCVFCYLPHNHGKTIPPDAHCSQCSSPLAPPDDVRLETSGQRRIQRIGKRASIHFYTDWPQSRPFKGVTANLSPHGLMFRSDRELTIGSRIKIDGAQFRTVVEVLSCRPAGGMVRPGWDIGGRFLTIQFVRSAGVFVSDIA